MRHKSNNKTRPLFTLSLEMTRLVKETRLLLVPGVNSVIAPTSVGTAEEVSCLGKFYNPPCRSQKNLSMRK